MTTLEKIKVMEAYERGEEIQHDYCYKGNWLDCKNPPRWSWADTNYRVKPREQLKQTVVIERWLMQSHPADYKTYFILDACREEIKRYEKGFYDAKPLKLLVTYEVEL